MHRLMQIDRRTTALWLRDAVACIAVGSLVCLVALLGGMAYADQPILSVDQVPPSGLVLAHVDLTGAARWCKAGVVPPDGIRAIGSDGQSPAFQFVPDPDFDPRNRLVGMVVLRLPKPEPTTLRIEFSKPATALEPAWDGKIVRPRYSAEHDPKRQGGLPWRISFGGGKKFDAMRWNNRLHHREKGSFCLGDDPEAKVERVSRGALCEVVRARARYVQGGKQAASQAQAVYDWYYFHDQPLVYVTASITQRDPFEWHEVHVLELNYPRDAFPRWAGGEPLEQGEFQATQKSFRMAQWGAIVDGQHAIGMFHGGPILLYDGGPGTYLQAQGDEAWRPWRDTRKQLSAWLWIGSAPQPPAAIQAAAKEPPAGGRVMVTVDAIQTRIEAVRQEIQKLPSAGRQRQAWRVHGARQLVSQGRFDEAIDVVEGKKPAVWNVVVSGDLVAIFERTNDGIRLVGLFDSALDERLSPRQPLPLFTLTLRHAQTKEEWKLSADAGWGQVEVHENMAWAGAELHWRGPGDKRLGDLRVVAAAHAGRGPDLVDWTFRVEKAPAPWSVWRVVFPQVGVADLGPEGRVFFPKAVGEVQPGVWRRPFRFTGTYPSGWTSMQYLAAYNGKTGLYVGLHDPMASTKDILVESRPSDDIAVLAFDHPAVDMGVPGNTFSTRSVWRLLRGDWFDAAVFYRAWVRHEARWYPKLGPDGRADTPPWMREMSVWALGGGPPGGFVPQLVDFVGDLGRPVAVHWYNWHQIPFDNDYPHYFPTHPGFAEAVAKVQGQGISVMPYINGRLWDTRDKGLEDFEFTKVARPAVSKNEAGEPYTETYGSKETDGNPVRLGVMCPSTELWQKKVREIVLRLYGECGVRGVYIDQVAAAAPTLCFDKSHGHPLGGGHWWTEGYWKLLQTIRAEKPADRMMTTECNGEPYIHCFDGYLTWHWQYDGQVPAFPAVYGGAIQMFGRSYGGGPTRDLALRMRAGQQLVYGEQIGWISPGVVKEKENAEFFRQVVHLRRQLARYFYAGEMARPPRLVGNVPTVRADWQWGGVDWVTTDAVLTGAWHEPRAKKLMLVFVNVSDAPVTARVVYDLGPYGFSDKEVRVRKIGPAGPAETSRLAPRFARETTFPPRTAWAWEATAP